MKKLFAIIRGFFLPPADAKTFARVVPLFSVAFIVILFFAFAGYAWEYTNAPSFCGLTCHTMPPEYITYQASPHTNIACEDCHMGRDTLPVMIGRKVRYSWQTGTAMLLNTYRYPIVAKNMAPAREACENCHKPEKFSTDKLIEIKRFAQDDNSTPASTFLVLHTGGGLQRQGLGYGIHWHIENPVYFYASDAEQQTIPYVAVTHPDGSKTEYVDVQSGFDPASIKPDQLKPMDCITCHNRTAHLIDSPQNTVDSLMTRGLISSKLPEIKRMAVNVLGASYRTEKEAMDGIANLTTYYQDKNADAEQVANAVQVLQSTWKQANFIDQRANWQTHPNNIGHQDSPGCFRCHDGKHIAQNAGSAPSTIRLECNLCHSVPVVSAPNQLTANLQLSKGVEPPSHKSANWISLHRQALNETCKACHTTDNPGGVTNTSFCSNSQCHGAPWQYAGFDAPKLSAALQSEAQALVPKPTNTPSPEPVDDAGPTLQPTSAFAEAVTTTPAGPVTYASLQPVLKNKCGACHGEGATKGLNVTTYATLMKGSDSGVVVVPGKPDDSMIYKVQTGTTPHYGQLSAEELDLLKQWILGMALEK